MPQKRLADKVSGILSRIEAELDAVDEKIGERMHILDLDNDGLVSHVNHPLHFPRLSSHELLGGGRGTHSPVQCYSLVPHPTPDVPNACIA